MLKVNCSILFFGRKEDRRVDEALEFCRENFSDVIAHLGDWGDPFPKDAERWSGDYIISYQSRWIIPENLLKKAKKAAINFHPAPPDYPGIGCANFALYEGAKEYGATCHHMAPRVDTGPIIAAERFPILPTDTVASLLTRTYSYQLALFYKIADLMIKKEHLPTSQETWTRRPFTRKELNKLGQISPEMSKEETTKRIRAATFGSWKPVIEFHGFTFQLKEDAAGDIGKEIKNKKILVLGSTGFLGKRVVQKLKSGRPKAEVFETSLSLGTDLRDKFQTYELFKSVRPGYVINCAAHVGGIQYGLKHPAEIWRDNTMMILNVLGACDEFGVKRLVQPVANCAYPANENFFKEEKFWSGPLHESVMAYGLVRKMGWMGAWAYHQQYQLDTISLVFSNMYGPGDHFDEIKSHALGALIKKIVDANDNNEKEVVVWGSGRPVREWLYVEDGAEAIIRALEMEPFIDIINIGSGQGISIKDLAYLIKEIVGWEGEFVFDGSKPDGAPYKTVDGSRGEKLLEWKPSTPLKEGVTKAVEYYRLTKKISQVMPAVDETELALITKSIQNKWLTEGPHAQVFLEKIKEYTGARYAVLAPSGTLGLFLALLALDLPKDSEIIIPSFTFFASASSAIFAGLTPVFVDVEDDTYNIDVSKIEEAITDKTKAIMPVHIYGHSCKIKETIKIAEKYKLKIVEDAAQGLGVFYQGQHVGTFGDAGVISFFADKTITTGEGAAVLTQNEELYNKLLLIRNQGRPNSGTFIHPALGMNFRMTDVQCAIGLGQFSKLPKIIEKKRKDFDLYGSGLKAAGDLKFLKIEEGSTFVPFRFFFRTKSKNRLIEFLETRGIQTRSFFYPMHLQPPLKRYARKNLPITENLYEEGICLPLHFHLSPEEIRRVTEKIKEFFNEN